MGGRQRGREQVCTLSIALKLKRRFSPAKRDTFPSILRAAEFQLFSGCFFLCLLLSLLTFCGWCHPSPQLRVLSINLLPSEASVHRSCTRTGGNVHPYYETLHNTIITKVRGLTDRGLDLVLLWKH